MFVISRTIIVFIVGKETILDRHKLAAKYAKALGHPVRVYIIEILSKQSCCYSGDLSEELPIVKSTLSQHLKVLKEAGLIKGEIEQPKIKYCINQDKLDLAKQILNDLLS